MSPGDGRVYREVVQVAEQLGLDRGEIQAAIPLSERHRHRLWRIVAGEQSYVLKWFSAGERREAELGLEIEIEAYRLLRELGVPTLLVHGAAEDALLLEDLEISPAWRLATEEDVTDPRVGRAVARWYRVFHRQGAELLSRAGRPPSFLTRETDRLDSDSIRATGRQIGLEDQPGWRLAVAEIESLKAALGLLPETLNYNDFYWTNLALSRRPGAAAQAIVFDYHLLGIGVRFSDCRNVVGSLAGKAVAAFWEEYGPVDEREEVLDRPLATLVALVTAARMSSFPRWALSSREQVLRGGLERDLRAALDLVRG